MKKTIKIQFLLLCAVLSINTLAQEYHYKEGFNLAAAANSAPSGWITVDTYPTNSVNHGEFTGDRCIRFNNSDAELVTPEVHQSDQLSFWLNLLDESDGSEKFFVEVKRGNTDFETIATYNASAGDFDKGAWKQFTIDINEDAENIQIRFSVNYGTVSRTLCLDDVSLTYTGNSEQMDDTEYPHRYYIDAVNGDDINNGKSEAKAWKTFTKLNAKKFQAADTILLKCNCEWNDVFQPTGSGNINNKIVLTSYGNGVNPIINAQGKIPLNSSKSASIRLYNQEYWKIENIKVENYTSDSDIKYGILIEAKDIGTLHGLHINNAEISNVSGDLNERKNGGLGFIITKSGASSTKTNFDGILVENCYFHDLANCGVFTSSEWETRDLTSTLGGKTVDGKTNTWFPSYNIVVRHNRFERIDGNGMVIRIADGPLVEHNVFYKCSFRTTGNASYPYNCDNALWQFNEASHTVYNNGDVDASGFDSDYFCKNTIIQYNYGHDNEWGSLLICSNSNLERAFNDGTIVRYNIFQNDKHHNLRLSGNITNSLIYNNVFYIGNELSNQEIIWNKNWGPLSPDKTSYYNNIFYTMADNASYIFSESSRNLFSNNVFYGITAKDEPSDNYKITEDPLFIDPGKGDFGFTTLDGYKLNSSSPAINAGKRVTTEPIHDFYGYIISPTDNITIGVRNTASTVLNAEPVKKQNAQISIFPNPTSDRALLDIFSDYIGKLEIRIFDMNGKECQHVSFNKNGQLLTRSLNVKNLRAGIYLVVITSDTETIFTDRIIKK